MTDTEANLSATFNELLLRYHIEVLIDPIEFTIKSPAAVDVEHDEAGNMVGVGVYDGHTAAYFSLPTAALVDALAKCDIVAHNGKGDVECLRMWGLPVSDTQLIHDTELIAHILDSSRKGYGLKKLVKEDLGIEYPSYEDIVGKQTEKQKTPRRTLDKWPIEIVSAYNAMDCYATYKLYERQIAQCRRY